MDYDFFGVGEQTLHLKIKKKYPLIPILVIGARGGPCFEDGAREWTSRSRKMVSLRGWDRRGQMDEVPTTLPWAGLVLGVRGWVGVGKNDEVPAACPLARFVWNG